MGPSRFIKDPSATHYNYAIAPYHSELKDDRSIIPHRFEMAYTKLMPFLAFGLLTSVPSAFAFFKVPCSTPLVIERVDPIISPGEVSSHVHTVMGGSAFGFDMDYAMTQTSGCNSCSVVEDKSNYWIAALYYHAENNSFIRVPQNGGALMYYQYAHLLLISYDVIVPPFPIAC